jgi:hypothetical protein
MRHLIAFVGIAAFTGCGARSLPGENAAALTDVSSSSSIRPSASSHDLLYVSSPPYVDVFKFPSGGSVGQINEEYPQGLCVNGKGDVFVVDADADDVVEYAHGGTSPKATLKFPGYEPTQCAADPATGDVAVVSGAGAVVRPRTESVDVWVYTAAKGKPHDYETNLLDYPGYLAYDEKSDLILDGEAPPSSKFGLIELTHGASEFKAVALNEEVQNRVRGGAGIQWVDGDLAVLTIAEYPRSAIDRLVLTGSKARFGRQTALGSSKNTDGAFWIQDGLAAVPEESDVGIWRFPQGGDPVDTLNVYGGSGVVVSSPPN